MPSEGIETTEPEDVYGQVHPVEKSELIESRLAEFEKKISLLLVDGEEANNNALRQAESKCPELLTREFKLVFLRALFFNVDPALKRYQNYWTQRVHLFGPEKAFQPLTITTGGALSDSDDLEALKTGAIQLCPMQDPSGRSLVLLDPSRMDWTKQTRESMVRVLWYVVHAALLEREESQKHGILFVWYLENFRLLQYDGKAVKLMFGTMMDAIPLRLSGTHVCYPPTIVKLVVPLMMIFLSERLRKRVKFHFGSSPEETAQSLEAYGLTKEMLPTELGGKVTLCIDSWIEQRLSENM